MPARRRWLRCSLAAPAGAQPAWAHQAPGFQSNGAVTVKSLAGGAYGGTQNPTGAVAKANQSAVTQPPTVIIQATSAVSQLHYDCYFVGRKRPCRCHRSPLWAGTQEMIDSPIASPVWLDNSEAPGSFRQDLILNFYRNLRFRQ
ncbi:hypothetical protein LJR269_006626 [Duganella sp. LjRoot269]